jgi:hypothetical protein
MIMINPQLIHQKYVGQSLSYDNIPANRGQCVQWAEYVLTDSQYGYGLQPFYGNAIDWWNNFGGVLAKNFDKITDGSIKAGDFVIFNQLVGSVYGHIDMALQDGTIDNFLGADSNWGGNLTVHQVQHVGRQYVIGSLRLKGGAMNKLSEDQFYMAFRGMLGRDPTAAEAATFSRDPTVIIPTLWNNGSQTRYNRDMSPTSPESKLKEINQISS